MINKIIKTIDKIQPENEQEMLDKGEVMLLIMKVFENKETYERCINALNKEFEEDIERKRFM